MHYSFDEKRGELYLYSTDGGSRNSTKGRICKKCFLFSQFTKLLVSADSQKGAHDSGRPQQKSLQST